MANLHIAVYLLTLGVSAGLTGIFGQRLLESQGVVPAGFQSDILLAAGAAAAYACVQLLYMGLIRLLYPTKSNGPVTGEILSLLGALAFVPYLLGFPLDRAAALFGVSDIPSAVLKLEPLLYLGLFGGIHGFFKLVSFYASMYSLPGSRRSAAVWLVAAFFAGGLAYNAGVKWIDAARTGQPYVTGEVAGYRVGQQYAYATEIPEGALFQTPVSPSDGMSLTWRWANSPANYGEEAPLDTVYVTATVAGAIGKPYVGTLQLSAEQWTSFTLPADSLPASATSCTVTWTSEREPAWRAQIGLPPAAASHRSLLVSGPFPHEERRESSGPNIVLIAVEGLGAQHVSGLGYERSTTPALDKFAYAGVRFVNAYTPSPEAPAACMTMLTGLNPLRHGYLGTQSGPLPENARTLAELLSENRYATAAFVESERPGAKSMAFGSGFERGFEVYDAFCPLPETAVGEEPKPDAPDSAVTLDRAAAWIHEHANQKFMVFIRLRELESPLLSKRYAGTFSTAPRPAPVDVYDEALAYVDAQIERFVSELRADDAGSRLCIAVTSPYGLDFPNRRDAAPERLLSEPCLRVPLFLNVPGVNPAERTGPIALEDVMPTLLDAAGLESTSSLDGMDLLKRLPSKEPVSMMGKPLVLTMRSGLWRFTWRSNHTPFQPYTQNEGQVVELYEVSTTNTRGARNETGTHPDLVTRYRDFLQDYLAKNSPEEH